MKRCTKCGDLTDKFSPNRKRGDGLRSACKQCENKQTKEYHRTKNGLISKIYADQRSNSKHRGHTLPTYTLQELRDWCFSQKIFHELYDSWKESGYKNELIPSCDRTDDSKGYALSRLQLMTWSDNKSKSFADMRSGKLIHGYKPQKSVQQRTLSGKLVKEYVSAHEAQRLTGIHQSNISSVCLGKKSQARGFLWNFTDKNKLLK